MTRSSSATAPSACALEEEDRSTSLGHCRQAACTSSSSATSAGLARQQQHRRQSQTKPWPTIQVASRSVRSLKGAWTSRYGWHSSSPGSIARVVYSSRKSPIMRYAQFGVQLWREGAEHFDDSLVHAL